MPLLLPFLQLKDAIQSFHTGEHFRKQSHKHFKDVCVSEINYSSLDLKARLENL